MAFAAPDVSLIADPPQPYGGSIGLDKAASSEVLLAWAMNGDPLPAVHGGPVRVVVPGYIGARSVKWLERVTAQRELSDNYFQATAYRLLPAGADPSAAGPGDGLSLAAVALNADYSYWRVDWKWAQVRGQLIAMPWFDSMLPASVRT